MATPGHAGLVPSRKEGYVGRARGTWAPWLLLLLDHVHPILCVQGHLLFYRQFLMSCASSFLQALILDMWGSRREFWRQTVLFRQRVINKRTAVEGWGLKAELRPGQRRLLLLKWTSVAQGSRLNWRVSGSTEHPSLTRWDMKHMCWITVWQVTLSWTQMGGNLGFPLPGSQPSLLRPCLPL